MEQRRLRLGDIIDDYCPRERRLSNHVVVAMIGDEVKQTRCTTCDADHAYKGARVPPKRRKQEAPAALYRQVLDGLDEEGVPEGDASPAPPAGAVLRPVTPPLRPPAAAPLHADAPPHAEAPRDADALAARPAPSAPGAPDPQPETARPDDEGPVHRPLIRATLPRPDGQLPERKAPDFTLRLPGARLGPMRSGGDANGNRAPVRHGKSSRPHMKAGRPPGPKGRPAGHRGAAFTHAPSGQRPRGRGPQGGGKKRSR